MNFYFYFYFFLPSHFRISNANFFSSSRSEFSFSPRVSHFFFTTFSRVFLLLHPVVFSIFLNQQGRKPRMDANVIDRLQQINLMSEEGEVITVRSERRDKTLEECFLNLLEKFLTPRPLNLRAAKNLLWFVWKMESDLKIIEVGDGLFQFKFALESQVSWVMNNGP